jgi:AraC-like DNA-binding protein
MQEPNGGAITYTRPIALPGTEVLTAKQDTNYWHYFHERYAVCALSTATAAREYSYRNKIHRVNGFGHMLLEPGETHTNTAIHQPVDFKVLLVEPAIVEEIATELGLRGTPHFRVSAVIDATLFQIFQQFYSAVEADETALTQQSLFVACVHLLLGNHAEKTPPIIRAAHEHDAIHRAKRYLQERYDAPVSLDELATVAGLSRFHLLRTFAHHTGLPPHAYQIHIRIERARKLLQAGELPSSVAAWTGFADQSHFTRHFKRIMGVTPGVYAQARKRR